MGQYSVQQGGYVQAGGSKIPEEIKKGVGNGQQKAINANKDDLKQAIEQEIQNVKKDPDIPPEKKRRILSRLKGSKKAVTSAYVAPKKYNNAVDKIQQARKARGVGSSKKAGSSKDSSGAGSSSNVGKKSGTSNSGATGTSGAEKKSKAFKNFNPEDFANLMMEDPKAAMEKLQKMDMKEMNMAMQMTQQYMQKIQRMFQLQSNISKISHKTSSSMIRNIR